MHLFSLYAWVKQQYYNHCLMPKIIKRKKSHYTYNKKVENYHELQ